MRTARLKNIALLIMSFLVALTIGEVAARVVFSDITTTADNRSYFALKWKRSHVRLNSLGFREKEIAETKPAGAYRVAFIGDSYAFGQGIDEAQRMSNLMEGELRKHAPRIEVLNFGNAGNNTADEVVVLEAALRAVKPDFVILQWFVNDVENKGPAVAGGPPALPEPSRFNAFKQSMRNMSVLYFLAAEVWHRLLESSGSGYAEDTFRRVGDPQSADSQAAERSLVEFIRMCRDHNVGLGIMLVPYFTPINQGTYPYAYLHQRVLDVCAREGVPCTDLFDTFKSQMEDPQNYRSLWVNRFDPHMGPLANQMATDHLVKFFGPSLIEGAAGATISR